MPGSAFRLDGRRILVTGASSDIGRAIAVACSQAGATLALTGRAADRLAQTRDSLRPDDGHVTVAADLTNGDERARVAGVAGALHGVVHAAALTGPALLRSITEDFVRKRFDVNYTAPLLLTQRLLRDRQLADGGSVVFISSISAHTGTRGMSVYAASKASLVATARCLALELAPQRIRVNCISPAIVRTSVYDSFGDEWLREQAARYPLGLGRPEDVANSVRFLLSDASRWVTGQTLILDGACPWV
jgi:NAD(P)-dependent dehydrogenase (short-subunit alcohol dehydrogenase family)